MYMNPEGLAELTESTGIVMIAKITIQYGLSDDVRQRWAPMTGGAVGREYTVEANYKQLLVS